MLHATPHIPVLLDEVLAALQLSADDDVLDATFGAGGYSEALLRAGCKTLTAFDRDPNVAQHVERVSAAHGTRFRFKHACFGDMALHLAPASMDAIVLDIGVSSMQIDEAKRGFSFSKDGALDMRMSAEGTSAADVVNNYEETTLADIIWRYGEERASRKIARAIVEARTLAPISTTLELRDIVHTVLKPNPRRPIDPATKTFQALRIYINQELQQLEAALHASELCLRTGGRLVVVTFHSLEDRIVKQFFATACNPNASQSRHIPINAPEDSAIAASFTHTQRKAVTASTAEIARNPRSRSAKLRAAIRTASPARQVIHA
jgi:16S rRNA (cytosine1402-N4)-methyltransferase